MSSSTSSSEARRARSFLVTSLALTAAIEATFGILADENRGRHEVDDRVHAVAALDTPPRTVLLADSVSYGVLDGVTLPDDVLDLSNNQSIGAAGNYFLLRRLVHVLERRGAPDPAFVVVAMNPVSWASDLDSERFLAPYFTSVFRRPDEIESVARSLDRPELTVAMRHSAFATAVQVPSLLRRGLVQTPVRDGLRELKRTLSAPGTEAVDEAPGGAALWSEIARDKISARALLREFSAPAVTAAYLPQIAALCRERGTRLVLLPAPVPPSVLEAWQANGYWASYLEHMSRLTGGEPDVVVVSRCPYTPPSDAAFYDGVHLVQSAKNAWADALARTLLDPEELLR